jgi:hypothetical protein
MLPGGLDAACADGKVLMHPRQVSRTTWVDGTQRMNLVSVHAETFCSRFGSDVGFALFSIQTCPLPRLFPARRRYVAVVGERHFRHRPRHDPETAIFQVS